MQCVISTIHTKGHNTHTKGHLTTARRVKVHGLHSHNQPAHTTVRENYSSQEPLESHRHGDSLHHLPNKNTLLIYTYRSVGLDDTVK